MPAISREFHAHAGNYTPGGNAMRWLVVHYTGAPGSARNTAMWSHNRQHNSSFHYVLDGTGTIYQLLDDTDTAWAVGVWSGCRQLIGNSESISIEVCSAGADFTPAGIDELRWLVLRLMEAHGIDAAHVVRHYDCHTGHKSCPAPYVDEGKWAALKAIITGGDIVTEQDIQRIADAVWARYLGGVRAIDRLQGIDIYMPERVWDQKLAACGGKSKSKFKAQEYLTNTDDRLAKMTARVDAIEKKLDAILAKL